METQDFVYTQVIDGLRLQAAPFDVQRRVLPDFVHLPDEILNAVFPDYFPQLIRYGRIPRTALPAIQRHTTFLDTCTPCDSYGDTPAEVENGAWFEELRKLARAVLGALGEDCSEPTLDGTTYVRGA